MGEKAYKAFGALAGPEGGTVKVAVLSDALTGSAAGLATMTCCDVMWWWHMLALVFSSPPQKQKVPSHPLSSYLIYAFVLPLISANREEEEGFFPYRQSVVVSAGDQEHLASGELVAVGDGPRYGQGADFGAGGGVDGEISEGVGGKMEEGDDGEEARGEGAEQHVLMAVRFVVWGEVERGLGGLAIKPREAGTE